VPLDIVLTDYDVVQPDVLLFMPVYRHSAARLELASMARGSEPVEPPLLPGFDLHPHDLLPPSAH
jgi:hypothetical protein